MKADDQQTPAEDPGPGERQRRLMDWLDESWEALQRGEPLDRAAWLRRHPEGEKGADDLRVLRALHAAGRLLLDDPEFGEGQEEPGCQAGIRLNLQQCLAGVPESDRPAMLEKLLPIEIEHRLRLGERPAVADYAARFPTYLPLIEALLYRLAAPKVTPADTPQAELALEVIEGPQQGQIYTLKGHDTFLVGRSPRVHLRLPEDDRHFSRVHFMIEVNPPHCRLTDLGSRNGTFVNDERVETADLQHGDQIRAGHTVLAVRLPVPPSRPPAVRGLTVPFAPWEPAAASPAEPASAGEKERPLPVLPGYQLVREVGRGGMGVVYEARRQADGARVAIKTIRPGGMDSEDAVARFLREASILCRLKHPNIVAFHEIGHAGQLLFFVMDYAAGPDAGMILERSGPLSVRLAVRIICQVLKALSHAHEQGFVHRDIKPSNILLAQEQRKQRVKVADFGLARVYQASELSGLTIQGKVAGTFAFMPPEQVMDFRMVQPSADQFSAGATLNNLLTGQYLFDFSGAGKIPVAVILTEDPVPIEQRRADLPPGLAEVIHRATAAEQGERYPDVTAFRQALLPFGR
jgi:serine/threonine-protein kinase